MLVLATENEIKTPLDNAVIISFADTVSPYVEYIKIGKCDLNKGVELAMRALKITPACKETEIQMIDLYDDDKFLCHVSGDAVIVDFNTHTTTMIGLNNDLHKRGLVLQSIYERLHQPIDSLVEEFLNHPRKISAEEKLYYMFCEVLDGVAVIYIDSEEELNRLVNTHIIRKPYFDINTFKYYHYFKLDECGFLHPVDHRKMIWDIIYPASTLIYYGENLIKKHAIGFSQILQKQQ